MNVENLINRPASQPSGINPALQPPQTPQPQPPTFVANSQQPEYIETAKKQGLPVFESGKFIDANGNPVKGGNVLPAIVIPS
jgi:hypothetical protein